MPCQIMVILSVFENGKHLQWKKKEFFSFLSSLIQSRTVWESMYSEQMQKKPQRTNSNKKKTHGTQRKSAQEENKI